MSAPLDILVVDDEALIRWALTESLVSAGHRVREASNAASAIAAASAGEAFDAIILDYRLPDSNDLHLLEKLRLLQPNAAVVMMSAFATPEMTRGAMNLGAHNLIPKPFELHHMVDVVEQASVHKRLG